MPYFGNVARTLRCKYRCHMQVNRRDLLLGSAVSFVLLAGSPAWPAAGALTPEMFGAKGDGRTNDTAAFARMAAVLSAQGGGVVELRKTTYIVGVQTRAPLKPTGYLYEPDPILVFAGLKGPLSIIGNGARLKAAAGLKYGTFDAVTGEKSTHLMPYIHGGELATPYRAMILISNCSGPIEIRDLELDGNIEALQIGGPYGDTGWQIPAVGIFLRENSGNERISNVYSHHHAQDGVQISGVDYVRSLLALTTFENVSCEYNARQGISLVGGRGYRFRNCKFNHTGKAMISSAPGAGVDMEAEGGKRIRDISFDDCEFSDNAGAGLVADTGDSEGAKFDRCTFIGTTNWSAWPNKPDFRFADCNFVGALVHPYGDKDPALAAQFRRCSFRDDPALSPTGQVYGGVNGDHPIADMPGNQNVLFDQCSFILTHDAVLPWSVDVIYSNSTLSQRSSKMSFPRGTYIGQNTLRGNTDLYGSRIVGNLTRNGVAAPKSQF